jgi:hypothetical protein
MDKDKIIKYALVIVLFVALLLAISAIGWNIYKSRDKADFNVNILNSYKNPKEAHNLLNWLNSQGLKLINHMEQKYKNNPDSMTIIKRLLYKYNPDNLSENKPIPLVSNVLDSNNVLMSRAYTTNFENISICLRRNDGSFYPKEILTFVYLHELSHIGSMERKHEHEFWTVFKFILTEAVDIGIIKPVNYEKKPFTYCGIEVKYNPYFDGTNISRYTDNYGVVSKLIRGMQFDEA